MLISQRFLLSIILYIPTVRRWNNSIPSTHFRSIYNIILLIIIMSFVKITCCTLYARQVIFSLAILQICTNTIIFFFSVTYNLIIYFCDSYCIFFFFFFDRYIFITLHDNNINKNNTLPLCVHNNCLFVRFSCITRYSYPYRFYNTKIFKKENSNCNVY